MTFLSDWIDDHWQAFLFLCVVVIGLATSGTLLLLGLPTISQHVQGFVAQSIWLRFAGTLLGVAVFAFVRKSSFAAFVAGLLTYHLALTGFGSPM